MEFEECENDYFAQMMTEQRQYPCNLDFANNSFEFTLQWIHAEELHIEAIPKTDPTVTYRGEVRAETKQIRMNIRKAFTYLQTLTNSQQSNPQEFSKIITVINCGSKERPQHKLRVIFYSQLLDFQKKGAQGGCNIIEFDLASFPINETYLLNRKMQKLEREKEADRLKLLNMNEEISKKIEEKDRDMKQAFQENMADLISAIEKRIEVEIEEKKKKKMNNLGEGIDRKKLQKKLSKKIKKRLKKKQREKARKRRQKRKKRKQKKLAKKMKKLLQKGQFQDIEISETNPQKPQQHQAVEISDDDQNHPLDRHKIADIAIKMLDKGERQRGKEKKKKKRDKEKYKERLEEANQLIMPKQTSINAMSKLRNRGGNIMEKQPQPMEPDGVEILQQSISKRKEKKKKKKKAEKGDNSNSEQENAEDEAQRKFLKRLNEIRQKGDIEQVRVVKGNRPTKPLVLAAPKGPLEEQDQFNPNYNGQPRYKPFVQLNQYKHSRPNEIFCGRLEQPNAQTRLIPIVFFERTPCYHNFEVSGNVIKKIGGHSYQQLVWDFPIPQAGTHILTMRIIQSNRFYMWFGVIDIREKQRQQSFNQKHTIAFSLHTGHAVTSNRWSKGKIGKMEIGLAIRMEINMDRSSITWHVSDGRNIITPIPKLMRKQTLVPHLQIMQTGDQVCFEE